MSASAWAILRDCFPYSVSRLIDWIHPVVVGSIYYPYVQIKFSEYSEERGLMRREGAFSAIDNYLRSKASEEAKRLRGYVKKNQSLVLSMDHNEEVADEFRGAKVWWAIEKTAVAQRSAHPPVPCERWHYKLTFHKTQRARIVGPYIEHVIKEGNATMMRNRERKLYTNRGEHWSHVVFEHPATFETLAMDPVQKRQIMEELMAFSKAEEFYKSAGRAWKRGYLLYGPPGTGKSTMIAAMANHLGYDLYDLELTSVKNNTELRKLLLETSNKSVIVIEDIDCSLDLTRERSKKKDKVIENEDTGDGKEQEGEEANILSQVTLSGLLNFIDGLWSACKGERLIVFTTNHLGKLDPALTRRGRLDNHIELSYCTFEAFKVLARNYLKLESHHLFPTICELLGETNVVSADVAEHLMPKTLSRNVDICLQNLIQALEKEKENGKLIAEEEREDGNNQMKRKCMTSTQDHLIEDKKRAKN